MNALVCGGAGYIGSHVNKLLNKEGFHTIVFDNLVYGHREAVKWGEFVQGDLRKTEEIEEIFANKHIDMVIHLAAYAYVGESVVEPEKYYNNNVVATLNLLRVMRKYGCSRIVFSSTCATYGIPEHVPIVEDMPQNPINPYGATKLMVERIFKDYHEAYGLEYVVLRYFNAAGADPDGEIGESHNPETHIIPLVLDAVAGRKPYITIFGTDYDTADGSCVRDYIHVSDIASAHVRALKYLDSGGKSDSFNLGNACGISVYEIVESAGRVTGKTPKVVLSERRVGDPAILVGSCEKAMRILGWKPQYPDIDTIMAHAWNWHQNKTY